jgi:glyoxalase family protein
MLKGHHHISMITKSGQKNNEFYTKVLGLRRVMMTVNQDSPDMYHLFFGDKTGAPGTELTFFEIPMAGMTHRGTNSISRIGLLVPSHESLQYWEARFNELGVKHEGIGTFAGREALLFEDHEGLRMALINHSGGDVPVAWEAWDESQVPAEHRILGMATIELTVQDPMKTISLLQAIFHYKIIEQTPDWTRIQTEAGGIFSEILLVQQDGPVERPGRGSVHHLAVRARDVAQLNEWDEAIRAQGYVTSGEVDRHFFQSVYFRDGNGILFELATDEPGFAKDGNYDHLGEELELPPKLEAQREAIIAKLAPLS